VFLRLNQINKLSIHGGGTVNKDRVKGTIDEVAGSAKRKAGAFTGNTKLEVEGMVQQAKGNVENAWGKTKDAVRDAVEGSEVHLDTRVTLKTKNSTVDAECKKCK
jgi:uncharacterized protein YjbJ (UPF0337 family)